MELVHGFAALLNFRRSRRQRQNRDSLLSEPGLLLTITSKYLHILSSANDRVSEEEFACASCFFAIAFLWIGSFAISSWKSSVDRVLFSRGLVISITREETVLSTAFNSSLNFIKRCMVLWIVFTIVY